MKNKNVINELSTFIMNYMIDYTGFIFLQVCIICMESNCGLYKGNKFQCHEGSAVDQKEHDRLCFRCASGLSNASLCPVHLESMVLGHEQYALEPVMLPEGANILDGSEDLAKGVSELFRLLNYSHTNLGKYIYIIKVGNYSIPL